MLFPKLIQFNPSKLPVPQNCVSRLKPTFYNSKDFNPSSFFQNFFKYILRRIWKKSDLDEMHCNLLDLPLRLNKIGKNPHLVSERDTLESDCQQMNDIVAALSAADNDSLDSLPSRCGSLMTLLMLSSSSPASSSSSSWSSQSGWTRAQSHQEVGRPRLECPTSWPTWASHHHHHRRHRHINRHHHHPLHHHYYHHHHLLPAC